MKKYIYDRFEDSDAFREKLIAFLRHNTNAEIGGYRIYDGTGNHYMQNPVEIADFAMELKRREKASGRKFKDFLEIGFSAGINNTFLHKMVGFSNIVAVDIITPAGLNPATFMANMRFKNLSLLCGDSTSADMVAKVKLFGEYDVIFIDGGHDYAVVKKDFKNYSPMLRPGGVLALHDIRATGHPGPGKLWDELRKSLKDRCKFREFYDRGNHTDYGIGMVAWR